MDLPIRRSLWLRLTGRLDGAPSPWRPGNPERPPRWWVFLRFLRYGLLAWGGPVAQIGLMHRELVERDRWVDEARFRKLFGLYQALPGPEALELTVYFGMMKAGRWAGLLAGLGFMLPGVLLVLGLAAVYVNVGFDGRVIDAVLYGMQPAVIGLIAVAALRLGRATVKTWDLAFIAAASFLASFFLDLNFILVLVAGGVVGLVYALGRSRVALLVPPIVASVFALPGFWLPFVWLFVKAGMLTFGGAYTIVPILQQDAVEDKGWIAEEDLTTALALTGLLPTPFISVASFLAYQIAGLGGALLATVLIFAPAFVFTLVLHPFFERILASERWHHALLGVAAAVIGLILDSTVPLAVDAIFDVPTALVAVGVAVALFALRMRFIPVVLLGAGVAGVVVRLAA